MDGEELDAYLLGVDKPVKRFTGRCIAIIQRLNDADDKLVVVPDGIRFTDDQIRVLTAFQEQFFESSISREGIESMSEQADKPPMLYHGSAEKLARLEPKPAHGVGSEEDQLTAVYATHLRNIAIAFSLPIRPIDGGGFSFGVDLGVERPEDLDENTEPRIDLEVGSLDLTRPGFVYVLPSDTFEQVDAWQWASRVTVEPLNVIRIDPKRYAHWIRDRREAKPGST